MCNNVWIVIIYIYGQNVNNYKDNEIVTTKI